MISAILLCFYLLGLVFFLHGLLSDLTNPNFKHRLSAFLMCLFWPLVLVYGILTGKGRG